MFKVPEMTNMTMANQYRCVHDMFKVPEMTNMAMVNQ